MSEKTIPIHIQFHYGECIGEATFFDIEKVSKLLGSAELGFSGTYILQDDGTLRLIELSLVPRTMILTLSLLDPENQNGNLKNLKTWTCNAFKGIYPVPVAAVVVAETAEKAAEILNKELITIYSLPGDAKAINMIELDLAKPVVRILSAGEY